jgi:hypothetical protein
MKKSRKPGKTNTGGMMENKEQVLEKVAEVYQWLDERISENVKLNVRCAGCGRCCNFSDFDHRLFVSSPELIYFYEKIGPEIKPMTAGQCPYNINGKCAIYEDRFAGCRIFFCKDDADFQNQLSESALKKFKKICSISQVPYRYLDLQTALNNGLTNICRSAEGQPAADRSI